MLAQPGAQIRASSDSRQWTSLYASVQREMPFEGVFGSAKDQLVVLHRSGPVRLERLCGNEARSFVVPAGGLHLIAAGAEFGVRLSSAIETVHVYVRRAVIEEVALEMINGDPSKLEIPSRIVDSDASLRALIEAAAFALDDFEDGSTLYSDYLSRTIAVQLIRTHASAKLRGMRTESVGTRMSPVVLEAIDYMNANIDQALSLSDIAQATNRSPSHIARMFRSELGVPPHRYLINLRVEKARWLLEKTSLSIAEIAYDCGFAHQEHLTRLFRRHCDTTPAAYRKSKRN